MNKGGEEGVRNGTSLKCLRKGLRRGQYDGRLGLSREEGDEFFLLARRSACRQHLPGGSSSSINVYSGGEG